METLTVRAALRNAAEIIGTSEGSADAREMLSAILDVNRAWPALHSDDSIASGVMEKLTAAARMRAHGAPIQYCVGKASFRHLTLAVDASVLIPRPETEILVDLVLSRAPSGSVADVGTGSGAIAIALATEGAYEKIIATDISQPALDVAKRNAAIHSSAVRVGIAFRQGNFLEPLRGETLDAIVSNPPYITDFEMAALPESVREWEPECALRSGMEGLEALRQIIARAPDILRPGGLLALETDSRRAEQTVDILHSDARYEEIEIVADLTGRDRFALARRR